MVRRLSRLAVGLLVAGLAGTGLAAAGAQEPPPSPAREAMVKLTTAIHEGNESGVLSSLKITSDTQREFVLTVMRMLRTNLEFREKFIRAYGDEAWKKFQSNDPKVAPKDGNATLSMTDRDEQVEKVKKGKLTDEKEAEAFLETADGMGKKTRIVKEGADWKVDAASLCPPEDEMKETVKKMRPIIELVEKYGKAIGKKSGDKALTGEDIDAELGRAIIKELLKKDSDAPHRFDVEQVIKD